MISQEKTTVFKHFIERVTILTRVRDDDTKLKKDKFICNFYLFFEKIQKVILGPKI